MNMNLLSKVEDPEVGDRVTTIFWPDTDPATGTVKFVQGEEYVVDFDKDIGLMVMTIHDDVYYTPLCWLDDKPVYVGDELHYKPVTGAVMMVTVVRRMKADGSADAPDRLLVIRCGDVDGRLATRVENLSWNAPKVKREGWVVLQGKHGSPIFRSGVFDERWQAEACAENFYEAVIGHLTWEESSQLEE